MDDTSPQLENGYTRLANELLDALIRARLSARQWAVVMAIIRKTYGFNKKADEIGLSQLTAMTGIDKAHLSRTVRELEAARIINREAGTHGHRLSINKRSSQWQLLNQQLPKEQQLLKKQRGSCRKSNLGVAESATKGLPKEQPQNTYLKTTQKTTPKDTCAALLHERFDRWYSTYPKKRNRAQAEKAFAKLNPDDSLLQTMIDAVEVAKRSRDDWRKDGGQFIPHAATWLNARGWEDEPDQDAYATAELSVIDAYNAEMSDEWPRAVIDPFSPERASAIRTFLGFAPDKPEMAARYFAHCNANLAVDERCGFDWLIKRETYIRVREDAIKHKDAA